MLYVYMFLVYLQNKLIIKLQVFWQMDFQSMKYLQVVKTYCNLVLKKTFYKKKLMHMNYLIFGILKFHCLNFKPYHESLCQHD